MDWARARAMLLLTFTVVNLALAYLLWGAGAQGGLAGSSHWPIRELRDRLLRDGIELAAALPPHGSMQPFLRVGPPDRAAGERLAALLSAGSRRAGEAPAQAAVEGDGSLRYAPAEPQFGPVNLENRSAVRQVADRFLREGRLLEMVNLDLRWARTYPTGTGRMVVEYIQHHHDRALFVGRLAVAVGPQGVVAARGYFPEVQGFRGEPKAVLAPSEALLRLAAHLRAQALSDQSAGAGVRGRAARPDPTPSIPPMEMRGTGGQLDDPRYLPEPARTQPAPGPSNSRLVLERIELGYYAAPVPDARAWDTVPVWRFLTSTGEVFYINAFTGELENP